MLQLAGDLRGYKLIARDGQIGKAEEFYFDDQSWAVRYLIADTGGWLGGRQVLISPYALDPARQNDQAIPVDLTKKQIENSLVLLRRLDDSFLIWKRSRAGRAFCYQMLPN